MELPDGIERFKEETTLNKVQIEQRRLAVAEMCKLYPNVEPMWIQWLWNALHDKTPEELEWCMENDTLQKKNRY